MTRTPDADAAFLRAIIDRPDDDVPRLVYADWLDERGDCDRAEFIRVQCRLAVIQAEADKLSIGGVRHHYAADPNADCQCDWHRQTLQLRRREGELHAANWDRWNVASSGLLLGGQCLEHWSRGFISLIETSWADFSCYADELLAACPIRCIDRAPRRKCLACNQWTPACKWCKGTGELPVTQPDWRGDGLVRLTTWPDIEVTLATGPIILRNNVHVYGESAIAEWLEWLAKACPGVRFELPPAERQWCTACDGDGLATGPPESRPCRRCRGTGYITAAEPVYATPAV